MVGLVWMVYSRIPVSVLLDTLELAVRTQLIGVWVNRAVMVANVSTRQRDTTVIASLVIPVVAAPKVTTTSFNLGPNTDANTT